MPGTAETLLVGGARLIGEVFGGGIDFRRLWQDAKEIQAGFNSRPRFPDRNQHQECWERFQSARSELARASQNDRENRSASSDRHRAAIMEKVSDARIHGNPSASREGGQILKDKGASLRRAGLMLSERKTQMLAEHKAECFAAIQEVQREHDAHWSALKEGYQRNAHDRRQRIEANIAANRERYAKCANALARQREHESKLESDIADARSRSFRERAEGWLEECRDKIRDMESSLERIQGWIDEGEEQLRNQH